MAVQTVAKLAARSLWFHPLLFGIYPVVSLLASNIGQVPLAQGLRLTLACLLLGLLVYDSAWVLLGHRDRAALASTGILVLMLSYGRLYDGLKELGLSGAIIVRHRYLLPAVAAVVALGVMWAARRRELGTLNRVLNVVSLAAVAFPLAVLGSSQVRMPSAGQSAEVGCTLHPPAGQPLPDVYVIIMDAYERDDVLRELHGYDNSPFLQALEQMGFYVACGSLSNYRHTELSLSSLLNMDYVQDFPDRFGIRPNQPGRSSSSSTIAACVANSSVLAT